MMSTLTQIIRSIMRMADKSELIGIKQQLTMPAKH